MTTELLEIYILASTYSIQPLDIVCSCEADGGCGDVCDCEGEECSGERTVKTMSSVSRTALDFWVVFQLLTLGSLPKKSGLKIIHKTDGLYWMGYAQNYNNYFCFLSICWGNIDQRTSCTATEHGRLAFTAPVRGRVIVCMELAHTVKAQLMSITQPPIKQFLYYVLDSSQVASCLAIHSYSLLAS